LKPWLIDFLSCSTKKIHISRKIDNEILSGIIFCDKKDYPIYRGLPIFIPRVLRPLFAKIRNIYESLDPAPWRAKKNDWIKHMRFLHIRALKTALANLPTKREIKVLAIGCGWGWEVWSLMRLGNTSHWSFGYIIGTDLAGKPLRLAKKIQNIFSYKNIDFAVTPAEFLPFKDSSFDLVTAIFGSLDHSRYYLNQFIEISRVLKPQGIAVFTLINKFSLDWLVKLPFKPKLYRKTLKKMSDPFAKVTLKLPNGRSVRVITHYYNSLEIKNILKKTCMKLVKVFGIFCLLSPRFGINKFKPYHKFLSKVDYLIADAPLFRWLGRYICVVARKTY